MDIGDDASNADNRLKTSETDLGEATESRMKTETLAQIVKSLEGQLKVSIPGIDVRYSPHIRNSFCVRSFSAEVQFELEFARRAILRELREETGLDENELESLDLSKFNVFLVAENPKGRVGLYGVAWHELAHVAAGMLGIHDEVVSESIAYACQFKGLLQAAKGGLFNEKEVRDAIAFSVRAAQSEKPAALFFIQLGRMGTKGIPERSTNTPHFDALNAMKSHLTALTSPLGNIDELIVAMDHTIKHTISVWKRRNRYPIVFGLALVAALLAFFFYWAQASSVLTMSILLFLLPLSAMLLMVATLVARKVVRRR